MSLFWIFQIIFYMMTFFYLSLLSMISRTAWLTATIRQHKLWNNKWILSVTLKENSKTWFCTSCLLIMDNQGGSISTRHWWKQTDEGSITTVACKIATGRKRKCARPPLAFNSLNPDMMWHMSRSVTLPPQSESCLSLGGQEHQNFPWRRTLNKFLWHLGNSFILRFGHFYFGHHFSSILYFDLEWWN